MYNNTYLAHYGVLGMKWGVRNYQNKDGSLTRAGQKRYAKMTKEASRAQDVTDKIMYQRQLNRNKIERRYSTKMSKNSVKGDLARVASANYKLNAKVYDKLGNKSMAGANKALATKYQNKANALDKAKEERLAKQKESKLKDFDRGTEMVKAGTAKYKQIIETYRDKPYDQVAKKEYKSQRVDNILSSPEIVMLSYTLAIGAEQIEKEKK